jgi:L-alanine-DL-glutamate epimerase-like enolase superfamily enzyme
LCEPGRTTEPEGLLILHNNAGLLETAASLHASNASLAAIPNVTLLEAQWANRDAETDVCWPYPEIVDGYALPCEGPGLGIEVRCTQRISVG